MSNNDEIMLRHASAKRSLVGSETEIQTALNDIPFLLAELDRLTAENAELRERVPGWIPVDEQLPDASITVLLHKTPGLVMPGWYCKRDDYWVASDDHITRLSSGADVTHWMPLPEPPKEAPNAQSK